MKPEALILALFIAIACCTLQQATAGTPHQGCCMSEDTLNRVFVTDTLLTVPPDTVAAAINYTDTLTVISVSESKDSIPFTLNGAAKQFVRDMGHTTISVATYPIKHWQQSDYIKSALLIGVSGMAYALLDDPVKNWAQRTRNSHSAFFSDKLQLMGQGYLSAGVVASFEIYGLAFKQKKARRVAVLSAESFIISTGICTVIKHLAGRARPNTGEDHDHWYGPQLTHKSQTSFFSGHTTAIFSVATVVALEYSNHKWMPPAIYSLATLAAASRIHDNKHWTSDVIFAALLSHYIAKTVVRLHNKMGNKFYLAPEIGSNYNGLAMHYCF